MLSYKIPWVVPVLQSFVPWATNLHLSYSLLSGQDTMVAGPSLVPMTKVQKTYRTTFVPVDAEITSERPWPFSNGWKRMATGEKCSVWATNLARTSTAAAAAASGIGIAQTQMKVTQELRKQGLKHLAAPATPQSTS